MAKSGTVLYTPEDVINARRNVKRYDWAKAELEAVLKVCRPWIARSDEEVWGLVTGQAIPRGIHVNADLGCPSCGREVYRFGNYPWQVSLDLPWKLQCPSCGEVFPKNDFARFHGSGLCSGGIFDRARADESLLLNVEDPDPEDPLHRYGVDDGYGWVDDEGNRWFFVAYYDHWCIWTELPNAALALGKAYLYTGDRAYAHKGSVLLDRIADVYPEMDLTPWTEMGLYNSHGGTGRGRIKGCIWETVLAETLSLAYDMVYEGVAGDEELVRFLSGKATTWGAENGKSSVERIRGNIETNLLREFIASCRDRRIRGNEGMTQTTMATAAAVLDDPEETPEALDWLFEPGTTREAGGHIPATLIGQVDRDGVGNEAAPGYCFIWMNLFRRCAKVLERCRKYREYDLHGDFPRLRRMYAVPYRLTVLDRYTPRIGDTGRTGDVGMVAVDLEVTLGAFREFGDPYFAQLAYKLNGDRVEGMYSSIFDAAPEAIQREIAAIVERDGTLELESANLNGYGLAVFRSGEGVDRRAAWLYYGRTGGHGHRDRLNIGMYYRGMDVLPDLGYPEYADGRWPKRAGWTKSTISHNTVMVNRRHQEMSWIGHCGMFATSEGVGVVEVGSPDVYPEVRTYRRTLAAVDLSASESYLVDLFRVDGGEDQVLSFHAGEGEVIAEGLDLTRQETGTYAGPEIPFGAHYDGPPDGRYTGSGFSYLYDVARAMHPGSGWWVDWTLTDTWRTRIGDAPVHLRYHGLSSSDDVALAWGDPPQNKPGNPRRLRYVLRRNRGQERRSIFVSVIEPYTGGRPNLSGAERIDLGLPEEDLTATAVRIRSGDDRTDLLLSSDDPIRTFDLGDGVRAAGRFVAVSFGNGRPASVFVVGGARVELPKGVLTVARREYTGTVKDLHREETGPAWIDVEASLPTGKYLAGAQIRVHNDGLRDACYTVQEVSRGSDGVLRVQVEDTTFIRGLRSEEDYSQGYVYNIAPGDRFDIQTVVHVRFGDAGPEVVHATTGFGWELIGE